MYHKQPKYKITLRKVTDIQYPFTSCKVPLNQDRIVLDELQDQFDNLFYQLYSDYVIEIQLENSIKCNTISINWIIENATSSKPITCNSYIDPDTKLRPLCFYTSYKKKLKLPYAYYIIFNATLYEVRGSNPNRTSEIYKTEMTQLASLLGKPKYKEQQIRIRYPHETNYINTTPEIFVDEVHYDISFYYIVGKYATGYKEQYTAPETMIKKISNTNKYINTIDQFILSFINNEAFNYKSKLFEPKLIRPIMQYLLYI